MSLRKGDMGEGAVVDIGIRFKTPRRMSRSNCRASVALPGVPCRGGMDQIGCADPKTGLLNSRVRKLEFHVLVCVAATGVEPGEKRPKCPAFEITCQWIGWIWIGRGMAGPESGSATSGETGVVLSLGLFSRLPCSAPGCLTECGMRGTEGEIPSSAFKRRELRRMICLGIGGYRKNIAIRVTISVATPSRQPQ